MSISLLLVSKSDFLVSNSLLLVSKSDFLVSISLLLVSKSDFLVSISLLLVSKSDFLVGGEPVSFYITGLIHQKLCGLLSSRFLICSGETLSVNDPLLILGSGLQGHELLQTPTLSTLALNPLRSCRHVRLQST